MDSTSSLKVMPPKVKLTTPKEHHHRWNLMLQKRKKSLKKKVEELKILCDIDACLICFVPSGVAHTPAKTNNDNNTSNSSSNSKLAAKQDKTQNQQDVEMWPGLAEVQEMVTKYRALTPEEQNKKKLDVSAFLAPKIHKLKNLLSAKMKENEDLQMQISCHSQEQFLNRLGLQELKGLLHELDSKILAVHGRIQSLQQQQQQQQFAINLSMLQASSGAAGVAAAAVAGAIPLANQFMMMKQEQQQDQVQGLDFNNLPNKFCNNNNNIILGFNMNSQFLHAMNSRSSSSNANHNDWTPYNFMNLHMPLPPPPYLLQQQQHAQQMLMPNYGYYNNNNNNNMSNNLVQHSSGDHGGNLFDAELLMDSQNSRTELTELDVVGQEFPSPHREVDLQM